VSIPRLARLATIPAIVRRHVQSRHTGAGRFEPLEARTLLSASLVADLNPAAGVNSNPMNMAAVNGTLFFTANGNSNQLYRSDGTTAGTKLLANLPGTPLNLTAVNDRLFFSVNSTLWESDGTSVGTVAVKSVPAPFGLLGNFTNVNGTLYFAPLNDGQTSFSLWKSDGTAAGTVLVKTIPEAAISPQRHWLTAVGGTLFFTAYTGGNQYQLWRSDGTDAGTLSLATFNQAGYELSNLLAVNGALVFTADDGVHGDELWRSDGTAAGTRLMTDLVSGIDPSFPQQFTPFQGGFLFVTRNPDWILYWSDGTTNDTFAITHTSGPSGLQRTYLGAAGAFAYGQGFNSTTGVELYKTDGFSPLSLVADINPAGDSRPDDFIGVGPTLFFTAETQALGRELWQTDGTAAGTVLVRDINPGGGWSVPGDGNRVMKVVNGTLFFAANDGTHGTELWMETTPLTAPLALKATAVSDTRISLSWTFPGDNATGFVIERSPDGTTFSPVATLTDPSATTYTDDGLTASTPYYYRVYATTAGSNTPPSNLASATTQPLIPLAPTNLTAGPVDGSATSIRLAWVDHSGNESGFRIERSNDGTNFIEVATVGADVVSYQDDSLAPATTYTYRIRATNAHGDSDYSNPAAATTLTPESPFKGQPLPVPGLVQAEDFDNGSSTISYFSPTVGNAGGTYRPGVKIGIQPVTSGGFVVATQGGAWMKYSVDAPQTGGTYNVELRVAAASGGAFHVEVDGADLTGPVAFAGTGGSATYRTVTAANIPIPAGPHVVRVVFDGSAALSFDWFRLIDAATVSTPAAPAQVQAFALNGPSLDVTWSPGSTDQAGFRIYRAAGDGTGGATYAQVGWADAGDTRFTDTTVQPLSQYTYYVIASNSAGDSAPSQAVTVTTLNSPARQVSATSAFNNVSRMMDAGGHLYFTVTPNGPQLWQTDGTTAGTVAITSPTVSTYLLASLNGRLLYLSPDAGGAKEGLWTIDTLSGAPAELANLNIAAATPGSQPPFVSSLAVVNGVGYFQAGTTLWRTDGTPGGTSPVTTNQAFNGVFEGGDANGLLVFTITRLDAGKLVTDLWRSDGTAGGTTEVHLFPGAAASSVTADGLTAFNGAVYFRANEDGAGWRLWRSDGTAGGTTFFAGVDPFHLTTVGQKLFYYGAFGPNETQASVYATDGTIAGTSEVKTGLTGSFAAFSGRIAELNGTAYFTANAGGGTGIWRSDGTPNGTTQVPTPASFGGPIAADGVVILSTANGLWSTGGTSDAEQMFNVTNQFPQQITPSGGRVFFAAPNGIQLWAAFTPPAPPATRVSAVGPSSVTVAWTQQPPLVSPVSAFQVERRAGTSGAFQWIADVPATDGSFTDTTVQPGVKYYYRVRAVNAGGSTPSFAVTPPSVQSVGINDGSAQRSMVTRVMVTFDQPVALDAGAFTLLGRNGAGAGTQVTVSNPLGDNRSYVLTFSGPGVVAGSLADGIYDLTVSAGAVHLGGAGGPGMAADFAFAFHRLFGDTDGDGDSDNADLFQFKSAYGASSADPRYRWYLDYDANGFVDNADIFQIGRRRSVTFKGY
jgi:ELWxxDGT repeat protein